MKKFICIILALAALLSLCSCTGIKNLPDGTATSAAGGSGRPSLDSVNDKRELKDESGRTVYIVQGDIPQFSGGTGYPTDTVNSTVKAIFVNSVNEAKMNIANAAEFMDSQGSSEPWSTKIDYELKYLDENIASFVCNILFSYFGPDAAIPSQEAVGCCVDLRTGERLNLLSFAVGDKDEARERLTAIIQEKAAANFFPGREMTAEELQLLADSFDENDFWYKDGKFCYFIDRALISVSGSDFGGSVVASDFYVCELTASDYAGLLSLDRQ